MTGSQSPRWTRRAWLACYTRTAAQLAALGVVFPSTRSVPHVPSRRRRGGGTAIAADAAAHAERLDPGLLQTLAHRAVDAARAAGAQYADARLTRTVEHLYSIHPTTSGAISFEQRPNDTYFSAYTDVIGVGVRVMVDGYWGFAANPFRTLEDVARLAQDAVGQAKDNATGGTHRVVEFEPIPKAMGSWATPIRIDPFAVPIEEKLDNINYWIDCAVRTEVPMPFGNLTFWRQERVVGTSDGALCTQTVYRSGGDLAMGDDNLPKHYSLPIHGIDLAGKGWELFRDAGIPAQIPRLAEAYKSQPVGILKPAAVGRYTIVCDGATIAALVGATLGAATQLDRALGYEANAGGTSFLNDPLAMLGSFQVASPLITVTTNRSAAAQLATVKWDDEGVEPAETTLVTHGVLTDFQTTREQANWLARHYHTTGQPVRSNGCAASETALTITMQHMPNLALAPNPADVSLKDLVADVMDGILIEKGSVECDFQGRTGLISGTVKSPMREIKHGRVGAYLMGGAVMFDTLDLWKHVTTVGGPSTVQDIAYTDDKGQPPQQTVNSVRAAAASISNQPLIIPQRRA